MYRIFISCCYLALNKGNKVMMRDLLPFAGALRSNKRIEMFRAECVGSGLVVAAKVKSNSGFSGYSYVYSITDKGWEMYREFCEALGIESDNLGGK